MASRPDDAIKDILRYARDHIYQSKNADSNKGYLKGLTNALYGKHPGFAIRWDADADPVQCIVASQSTWTKEKIDGGRVKAALNKLINSVKSVEAVRAALQAKRASEPQDDVPPPPSPPPPVPPPPSPPKPSPGKRPRAPSPALPPRASSPAPPPPEIPPPPVPPQKPPGKRPLAPAPALLPHGTPTETPRLPMATSPAPTPPPVPPQTAWDEQVRQSREADVAHFFAEQIPLLNFVLQYEDVEDHVVDLYGKETVEAAKREAVRVYYGAWETGCSEERRIAKQVAAEAEGQRRTDAWVEVQRQRDMDQPLSSFVRERDFREFRGTLPLFYEEDSIRRAERGEEVPEDKMPTLPPPPDEEDYDVVDDEAPPDEEEDEDDIEFMQRADPVADIFGSDDDDAFSGCA